MGTRGQGSVVAAGGAAPPPTRVDRRRETARQEILDAAAQLARERGLGELSLRELAAAVGMKAPSLYSYFPSKAAIYDALFARGYRQLDATFDSLDLSGELREVLARVFRSYLTFCTADLPRYQLMFTRVVPGWEPSPEAYDASRSSYARLVGWFEQLGITDPAAIDLWTGLTAGFAAQQVANDPDGDRWFRLIDPAVAAFVAGLEDLT